MIHSPSDNSCSPVNVQPTDEPQEPVFYAPQSDTPDKEMITFEGVEQIDLDADLGFRLKGHSLNPLLDAATPLFGLVIRARRLSDNAEIPQLYVRVRDEITIILEEIRGAEYDAATQLAYSYCLCAFVDEAIMGTPWGAYSVWAERSMLSIYHDETWGGEKFFSILSRMLLEPEKYQHMLELGYYCLALGFRGKYGMQFDGAAELQAIMRKLHDTVRKQRGDVDDVLQTHSKNLAPTEYHLSADTPLWRFALVSISVVAVAFFIYRIRLDNLSAAALNQLSTLLPG